MSNTTNYNYGAYINFAFGGQGSDPTNPIAQTGDLIGIVIAILMLLLTIGTGAIFVYKFKDRFSIQNIRSKSIIAVDAISSHKTIVLAIFAAIVIACAGFIFASKAFAESNAVNTNAAPPYAHATATMDKYNGSVSLDTIHVHDQYCKDNNKFAIIDSFSIFTVNGFSASELGTWHVWIDGIDVYTGPAAASIPFGYYQKTLGEIDIDVSVEGISPSTFEKLSNRICVEIIFGSTKDLQPFEEAPDTFLTTVKIEEDEYSSPKSFTKAAGFNDYIISQGWSTTDDVTYTKDIASYTTFENILEPWYYAYDNNLLTCNYETAFYRWMCRSEKDTIILLQTETFYPVWYPTEKTLQFSYELNAGDSITPYGDQVIKSHNWSTIEDPSFDGDDRIIITGSISNLADISEISSVLTAQCFNLKNGSFAGWDYMSGKVFQLFPNEDNSITCKIQVVPEFVVINGKVVDANGVGTPNVAVTFEDTSSPGGTHRFQRQSTMNFAASTITDANGNYYLTYIKGTYGILRFGSSPFDESQIDNTIVGQSLFVNYFNEQTMPTVTITKKVLLKIDVSHPDSESNGFTHLDYGEIKFITSDGKVFYGDTEGGSEMKLETYEHVSGKVVYETAYYYGEVYVADTGTGETKVDLNVYKKTIDKSDCQVSGTVYVKDADDNLTPLKSRVVWFKFQDFAEGEIYLSATTDANGNYSLPAFQDLVLLQVAVFQNDADPSPGTEEYSWHYDKQVILTGATFSLNIEFFDSITPGDEISVVA